MSKLQRSSAFLTAALVAAGFLQPTTLLANQKLADVEGHWAQKQIENWVDKGLANGYEDQTFKPDNKITRAEFISLVNRAFGFHNTQNLSFSDVNAGDWFSQEVAKATAAGYISGYEDGTLRPNNPISRQEVAGILSKIKHLSSTKQEETLNRFTDNSTIPQWSKSVIGAVVENGYMSGYPDNTFQPERSISRAEAIVSLDRVTRVNANQVKSKTYSQAGTYGPQSGTETIEGDVFIQVPGVTLQNVTVNGNLILGEGVGEGDVNLTNVKVTGTTTIQGGGEHSIHLRNVLIPSLVVNKKSGNVRIEASGSSFIQNVTLESGAKLEESQLTGEGFQNVVVDDNTPNLASVTLVGDFENVGVNSSAISLELTSGTVNELNVASKAENSVVNLLDQALVKTMTLDSAIKVQGKGSIAKAVVKAIGTTFETEPKTIEKSTSGAGGGGGGGGAVSTPVAEQNPYPIASGISIPNSTVNSNEDNHIFITVNSGVTIQSLNANINVPSTVEFVSVSGINLAGKSFNHAVNVDSGYRSINIHDMLALNMFADGIPTSEFAGRQLTLVVKLTSQADSSKSTFYTLTIDVNE